ncbi:MAG: type I secretion system permease/ATPase [Alphaproteobacteria bacterium]|nr:type I secretion system permease/ATPase [Alphaproteobacteria bacterium]
MSRRSTSLSAAVKEIRTAVGMIGVFSVFVNLLMFAPILYMLQVFDRVLATGSLRSLAMLTVAAVLALAVYGALDALRGKLITRMTARLTDRLDGAVADGLSKHGVDPFETHAAATKDIEAIRSFIAGNGLVTVFDAPWAPVFLAVIWLMHPVLGIYATAGCVLAMLLAWVRLLRTKGPMAQAGQAKAAANRHAADSMRRSDTAAAMGLLPGLTRRWIDGRRGLLAHELDAGDRAAGLNGLSRAYHQLLGIGMLGLAAYFAVLNQVTFGTVIVARVLLSRAVGPLTESVRQWQPMLRARRAWRQLHATLAEIEARPTCQELPPFRGDLDLNAVAVQPPGRREPVLRDLDFSIGAGEALGILGPSGAGKSTLARALVGAQPAAAGVIRLDGAALGDWDRSQLGRHVGYLPQEVELFEGTAAENIARFTEIDPGAVVRAARLANIHDTLLSLPLGYDTQVGPGGQTLSAGERRRIGLARAFYGDVRLLVLDEPHANLDRPGEQGLIRAFESLKRQGCTLVVISHRRELLSIMDTVLIVENGGIKAFGPRQQVLGELSAPKPQVGTSTVRRLKRA